ncbi:hypothetical protein ERJ70_06735 [Sediminibacillus dalangtanensis]|uniref:Uncharacterized protein n=1 Tax=Sediminibacillus dalangtanensis TaxID=2729421 RepID=A0ABX7VR74_9BACI|nr:hypothetical protein [Sediminibacillus dalangtanensis]QTM99023.1 hypothetical protein ERJ70_06735 [Sediminibacillus dalangtanensis]
MVERYIYAVTQRLPQGQRQDIAEELRGLIEDMLDEGNDGRPVENSNIERVLIELGSPSELAEKYRGTSHFLVGPDLFPAYLSVMKLVFIIAVSAMGIIFAVETILTPLSILSHFVDFLISLFVTATQAFAWITAGFAAAQYFGMTPFGLPGVYNRGKWNPSELPPVPDEKKRIKRGDVLTGIIFSILLLVVMRFSNHLFGILLFEDHHLEATIPFLNEEKLDEVMPLIYLMVAIGIVKEITKLMAGKWTKNLAVTNLVINGAIFLLAMLILRDQAILNPDFVQQLTDSWEIGKQQEEYMIIKTVWNQSYNLALAAFVLTLLIDTMTGFYKALRK